MFTHLHVHTEYSLLDGLSRIDQLVERAEQLGMDSLAITDHGGMYGAIDFYNKARAHGIKPIIGCEMYVAPGSRHERNPADKSPYHMTVLAQNAEGYRNLIKLVTKSHVEGFYYRPRIDRELLERHHEGIIVMSGCPSGEVPGLLAQGRHDEAAEVAGWYRELFGERYFLEVMRHGGVPELPAINRGLLALSDRVGIPVVGTNDSHYVDRDDAHLQDIVICIHTNTNINDEKRLKMEEASYYLKSHQEMVQLFEDLPEAVTNTERIAEMCDLKLDFSQLRLPQFPTPDGMTADDYLTRLCEEGLRRRTGGPTPAEEERLRYELDVIRHTQFADYFLVVWDIAKFVRERDIFFAVRGSAAASLALFCLGVTDVNPLEFDLVFERFLNMERKEMPDIDMDFQDDRREEVINYVVAKYGREHVAQIITFGTLGARASIRDVGRALGMSYADVDRVARLVPFRLNITLPDVMKENAEFSEVYEADESIRNLIDTSMKLEGLTRHSSTHAAGVVISGEPLDDVVPLQRPSRGDGDGVLTTQYSMDPIAELGLLKMDFLGLANLTVLAKTRDLISETRGEHIELQEISLEDTRTFELLSRGDTVGVFQMEGSGMTRYIRELKPSSLGDVAAMIALYRPGPMEHITAFIDAKHGREKARYLHPALEDILRETYGIIVYQDQVLQIFRTFAGYSLGAADIVRKAMGKKIAEIMAEEEQQFIEGAMQNGYTRELAEQLFALITPFAGYAFNKAHSVSYGLISYWTAYFKANYPVEYMASLLNANSASTDRIANAVNECRRMGIQVLPPDIRLGEEVFSIEAGDDGKPAIRFGMASVKNVGGAALEPVIAARKKEGPFESIEQMCRVSDFSGVNRKALESLIRAGALDAFGERNGLLSVIDRIISLAQSESRLRNSNQSSMFDMFGESVPAPLFDLQVPVEATSEAEKWRWEKELLGVGVSNTSLLSSLAGGGDPSVYVLMSQLTDAPKNSTVRVRGQVASVDHRSTRENKPFAIASLALMDGPVEVFVWEEALRDTRGLWQEGNLVTVTGTVRVRDDEISLSCRAAEEFRIGEEAVAVSERPAPAAVSEAPRPAYSPPPQPAAQPPAASEGAESRGATPARANGSRESAAPPSEEQRNGLRLTVRMRETGEQTDDNNRLQDVKRALLNFRGEDEVGLQIVYEGRVVHMDWPQVRVTVCDELATELEEALSGQGEVIVEASSW